MGQLPLATREARLAMKWVRQRCQEASAKTFEMAALMPPWASEITSSTPLSPRATRARKNAVHAAVSSVVAMSRPTISRRPSTLTAVAMTAETLTTRPPSRTLCVKASIHR